MAITTPIYVYGNSWLHQLDPRVKLLFAVGGMATMLTLGNLPVFLAFLVVCHVLLLSAGVPASRLAWGLAVDVADHHLDPGSVAHFLHRRQFRAPQAGSDHGHNAGCVAGSGYGSPGRCHGFCLFVWLFTTDQESMVAGLVGLGIPYEWGLVVAISLRYVPTLYESFQQVLDAQRARGLVIPRSNPAKAARSYVPALVATLIGALRTAEHLSWALQVRAFGAAGRQRTIRRELRFRPADGGRGGGDGSWVWGGYRCPCSVRFWPAAVIAVVTHAAISGRSSGGGTGCS